MLFKIRSSKYSVYICHFKYAVHRDAIAQAVEIWRTTDTFFGGGPCVHLRAALGGPRVRESMLRRVLVLSGTAWKRLRRIRMFWTPLCHITISVLIFLISLCFFFTFFISVQVRAALGHETYEEVVDAAMRVDRKAAHAEDVHNNKAGGGGGGSGGGRRAAGAAGAEDAAVVGSGGAGGAFVQLRYVQQQQQQQQQQRQQQQQVRQEQQHQQAPQAQLAAFASALPSFTSALNPQAQVLFFFSLFLFFFGGQQQQQQQRASFCSGCSQAQVL